MTSTINVFTWQGVPLVELDAATKRYWVTNDGTVGEPGHCTWKMSTGDPKCIERYLRFGNLVLIRHATLPDWVGVIHTPRNKNYGEIEMYAYSAEKILQWRAMPLRTEYGDPGVIFGNILQYGNQLNGTQIHPGSIFLGGTPTEEILSGQGYDHAVNVAKNAGHDWDVTYQLDAGGNLVLYGNWYENRGVDTGLIIDNNRMGYDPALVEQDEIWNYVNGYGDASSEGTRYLSPQNDQTSAALYGPRSYNWTGGNVTNPSAVTQSTSAYLNKYKNPAQQFNPTIPESSGLFPYLRIGNIFNTDVIVSGISQSGLNYSGKIKLGTIEYDDLQAEAIIGGDTQ